MSSLTIFKTEHILRYMSDKTLRHRIQQGLLKGEQIHALARDVNYGKRGGISTADLREQKKSCSGMTLILATLSIGRRENMIINAAA